MAQALHPAALGGLLEHIFIYHGSSEVVFGGCFGKRTDEDLQLAKHHRSSGMPTNSTVGESEGGILNHHSEFAPPPLDPEIPHLFSGGTATIQESLLPLLLWFP
jgi:hypothetical protein